MYPFNVIWLVRVILVAALMSLCVGATFVGTRWRFWDSQWQRNEAVPRQNQSFSLSLAFRRLCRIRWKKIPSKLHLLLYKRFHLFQHSRLTNPTLVQILTKAVTNKIFMVGILQKRNVNFSSNLFYFRRKFKKLYKYCITIVLIFFL
jgi:hypothetical protein